MSLLEVIGLTKRYQSRWVALSEITFSLDEGEFAFLVGPSGAGKSTLISIILAEIPPDKGKVIFNGVDITTLSRKEIPFYRRKLGVIFQDFRLLPDKTAWENVAFALYVCGYPKKYIRQRTGELLSQVGLLHKARAYPQELSGGEQQRVAIARALVHSPLLLLADEPTGNLDPNSIDEIMELLIEINSQGTAILMATHNIELVERFGFRVIELAEGRLIGDRPGRKPK